jgi:hypothetical protein
MAGRQHVLEHYDALKEAQGLKHLFEHALNEK